MKKVCVVVVLTLLTIGFTTFLQSVAVLAEEVMPEVSLVTPENKSHIEYF